MASDPESTATAGEEGGSEERIPADLTPHGRYIPYGGGSAGWFENSGVLKSERRNNYKYHEEMDLPEVRSKQFLRWGPAFDRRDGTPRKRRQLPINLLREGSSAAMTTWDINNRGIRLQFTESPNMAMGDAMSVELLDAPGGKVLTMLDANVIWLEQGGAMREVWNVGLFFPYVSAEAGVTLNQLLNV
jgi:hypothetical protein